MQPVLDQTDAAVAPQTDVSRKAWFSRSELIDVAVVSLFALAASWMAYLANGRATGIDDADIFFTYADHLTSGRGLVFSPRIPVVEGYTSTLWMLVSALSFLFGLNERGVLVAEIALFAFTNYLMLRTISRLVSGSTELLCKLVYLALVATSFGYVTWNTVTLMDTGVWSALIIWMTCILMFNPTSRREWIIASIPFILAPIARPEALIVAPAILVLIWLDRAALKLSWRPVIFILGGVIASNVLLVLFRLAYFGYPLPNTYYAKVSSKLSYNVGEGLIYLSSYVLENAVASIAMLAAAIAAVVYLVSLAPRMFSRMPASTTDLIAPALGKASLVLMMFIVLPLASGGDHFRLHRFYQPVFPLACLTIVMSVMLAASHLMREKASPLIGSRNILIAAAGVLTAVWGYYFSATQSWSKVFKDGSPIAHEYQISRAGRAMGQRLDLFFVALGVDRPGIGVITVGGFSRTYTGSVYDLMGLNNAYIAHFPGERVGIKNHAAFEKDAFFNMQVDMLIDSPDNGFAVAALKYLFHDPRFIDVWTYGRLSQQNNPEFFYEAFFRKGFVEEAVATGKFRFEPTRSYSTTNSVWEAVPPPA